MMCARNTTRTDLRVASFFSVFLCNAPAQRDTTRDLCRAKPFMGYRNVVVAVLYYYLISRLTYIPNDSSKICCI
jgi:hypothetical protein